MRGARPEDGYATVWVLTLAVVLLAMTTVAAALGEVAVVRHRAATAADLAAIAAAQALAADDPFPCADAERAVTAAGVLLVACSPRADGVVDVAVRARPGPLVAALAPDVAGPTVRARAGPRTPP